MHITARVKDQYRVWGVIRHRSSLPASSVHFEKIQQLQVETKGVIITKLRACVEVRSGKNHRHELVVENAIAMIDCCTGMNVTTSIALVPNNFAACCAFVFQTCGQADFLCINRVSVD